MLQGLNTWAHGAGGQLFTELQKGAEKIKMLGENIEINICILNMTINACDYV